jgi:hypothetical protein
MTVLVLYHIDNEKRMQRYWESIKKPGQLV